MPTPPGIALTVPQRQALRAARTKAGLSMTELGRALGLSHAALSYFEAGKRRPSLATLTAWLAALGVRW